MNRFQQTIKDVLQFSGVGLFSGKPVSIRLKPAPADTGIKFIRTDLAERPFVVANADSVDGDVRRVVLKNESVEVESVEHFMASLSGLCIDNIVIEIDSKEMPVCDGSSLEYVDLFRKTTIVKQDVKKRSFISNNTVEVSEGDASISIIPDNKPLRYSYTLDYFGEYINDEYSFTFAVDGFCNEIAPSRTFGIISDVLKFKELGIGKGITDENTFVIKKNGDFVKPLSMSPARLRFPDECVRHKILDLIGDLSLSNVALSGHVIAKRSGHGLNLKMAKKLSKLAELSNN